MDHLKALEVFAAIAREGSLSRAARALAISPPSVTRLLNDLEAHLGTPLLTRSTRAIRLTETGRGYLADAERILEALRAADSRAQGARDTPRGTLRLTSPVLFGQQYVAPVIADYLAAFPEMRVDAAFLDRNVNLIDEGFDVAIRIGTLPDSGHRALRVGAVRLLVCASPEYLARRGTPAHPRDLADHDTIQFKGAGFVENLWSFDDGLRVPIRPRLLMSTVAACVAMAEAGLGLTQVLSYQVAAERARGSLVSVLDRHGTAAWPIHLLHNEHHGQSAKLRAFLDIAVERLRTDPRLHQPN